MRRMYALLLAATLCGTPLYAQEDDGRSMMERGAQEFLEGLLREMEPAWLEFQAFIDAMGPALAELMEEVKDWSVYEPPEVLENGDIIIRRKPDPAPDAEAPETNEPIEL